MVRNLRRVFIALGVFMTSVQAFSQVVKTPFPVTNLSWTKDSGSFAYTEENTVFLRDSKTYSLLDTLPINSVDKIMFSTEGRGQVLLAITKDGIFSVYNLEEKDGSLSFNRTPYFTLDSSGENDVGRVAFSKSSDYVAVSLPDNSVNVLFKLRLTTDAILKHFEGHTARIYNLGFSNNETRLISTAEDGQAIIWDLNTQERLFSIEGIYTDTRVPAIFLNDSKRIIACDGETSFCIYGEAGEKLVTVDTLHKITGIETLRDDDKIAVVTETGEIEIYGLKNTKWTGYIPSYDPTALTDFEFNSDDTRVLLGYESGSIFEYSVKDVLLNPGDKPPKQIQVWGGAQGQISGGDEGSGENGSQGTSTGGSYTWSGSGPAFRTREGVYGEISVSMKNAPSPYTMSAELSFGAVTYSLLQPFFIGARISPYIGFPKSDYPYKYSKSSGESIDSPLLAGMELCVPFGLFLYPFADKDIGISAEVFAGAGAALLWNRKTGSEAVTSKVYISVIAGTNLAVYYKFLKAYIGAEYDSVQKILINGGVGCSMRIKRGPSRI